MNVAGPGETARLTRLFRAGARVVLLRTAEEERALALLEQVADALELPCHTWSAAAGIDGDASARALPAVLERLRAGQPALWVLFDAAPFLGDPARARAVRELAQSGAARVVITGASFRALSRELLPEAVRMDLPLPGLDALREHALELAGLLARAGHRGARDELGPHVDAIARAALGLSLRRLSLLVAEAVHARGRVDGPAIATWLIEHKGDGIDGAGLLERVPSCPEEHLGGMNAFKRWARRRALALTPAARAAGIPAPRGVLLLGVQGCGKSLAARACATLLGGLPLARLDPGRLYGGTVGESEANLRTLLRAAERMAPLVLWIDEIDKVLAGSEGTASDAGTAARVVGGLLTWLQERARPVFVVMTANRVDTLPPELMRRGRLDELFFVDLPGAEERAAILDVHLSAIPRTELGAAPPTADPQASFLELARAAEGYSGAELEAALVEARLAAFADQRPLAAADLERALADMIPLSRTRAESLTRLRAWAETRARRA